MSSDDNLTVVGNWARAAFGEHDLDAAAEFLADDWVGHWAALPEGHGAEGFKRLAGTYLSAFPDIRVTVEDALEAGDRVVRRISWTATHQGAFMGVAPTGRRVHARGIVILRLSEGKIAEEWEVTDVLSLLQQLGAAPHIRNDFVD